ncbi:DUF6882 domain-containing protein [Dokdonella sp.]|uniref:DUF6882 domain-containing protein n=1 Tax=Dokdonella sp. TaxID=2291710 RepID=UPI0037836DC2
MTDEEFDAFVADALAELDAKQSALEKAHGLGRHERFDADFERATLRFSDGGTPVAEAMVVPVASFVPSSGSLVWWRTNRNLPEATRAHGYDHAALAAFTGMDVFAQRAIECDEDMAWEITAMACKHAGLEGAYVAPHGAASLFLLIAAMRRLP